MDNGTNEESARVKTFWLRMRALNRFAVKRLRQGWGPQQSVLLLTTTGRWSGLPRVTPLQFEEQDGIYYVASGRGVRADWVRNLAADPAVLVEVNGCQFAATAELVTDPQRIAEFLALRLRRHPIMVRAIMMMEGLPLRYSSQDLAAFASHKAMAVLRPLVVETPLGAVCNGKCYSHPPAHGADNPSIKEKLNHDDSERTGHGFSGPEAHCGSRRLAHRR